jgi:hypothetical protein
MFMHLYGFAYLGSAAAEVCCVLPYAAATLHVDTTIQNHRHCDTCQHRRTAATEYVRLKYPSLKLRPM